MRIPPVIGHPPAVWLLAAAIACGGDGPPAAAPILSVTPEVLDFGATPIDAPATLPITLANEGGGDLTVLSLTLTEGDADIWSADRNGVDLVAAQGAEEVLVTFSPEDERSYTGQLQIRTDAEDGSVFVILQGLGGPSDEDYDGDGFSRADGDCDDGDPTINPGAAELCDGRDTDCNGAIPPDEADADYDGWLICDGDCDDGNGQTYPGAPEICDDLDNDCDDAVVDRDDQDGDGLSICDEDCDDLEPAVYPGALEVCGDGLDNDCDGGIDDVDADGDGHSACSATGDCDDGNPDAFPVVVATDGDDAGLGTDDDPYLTLGFALANLDQVCRTVILEAGTYGEVAEIWSGGDVLVAGRSGLTADVVLEANKGSRHFDVSGGGALTLRDLTLTGGDAPLDGGALQITNASVVLDHVALEGNASATDGGAVAVSSGTLTLIGGCTFDGNTAGDNGGAIVSESSVLEDVEGTTYTGNAAGDNGGALQITGGTATVQHATFDGNAAFEGGAASLTGAGTFVLEANAIWRNTASADGGGIALRDVQSPQGWMRTSRYQDNVADGGGGAIAVLGGGVLGSAMRIHNNTFTGNTATTGEGAGLWIADTDSGGVSFLSNVMDDNNGASALHAVGGAIVTYNTVFGTDSSFNFAGEAGDGSGGPVDPTNFVRNPELVTVTDNGDPTDDDLTLSGTSPEIDAGPPQPAFYDEGTTSINDRGFTGGPGPVP